MANTYVKSDKKINKFIVFEEQSEHILATFDEHSLAKKFSKKQNGGCGFNGFTPQFVLKSVKDFIP